LPACHPTNNVTALLGTAYQTRLYFSSQVLVAVVQLNGVYDGVSDVGCGRSGRVDDVAAARQGIQAGHQRAVKSDREIYVNTCHNCWRRRGL